jgi:uridine kinase
MSMDDYQAETEQRHRRGRYSPEGYYHDAIDRAAFFTALAGLDSTPGLIVLVDGVFLLRPELNATWDYRIFVDVDLDIAYERGIIRDLSWMGEEEETRRRYELRYIPGERLYLDEVRPLDIADAVIENTNPDAPHLRLRD